MGRCPALSIVACTIRPKLWILCWLRHLMPKGALWSLGRGRCRGALLMGNDRSTWDVVCPMHLQMDAFGVVVHVGPTLAKLQSDSRLNGRPFLTVFDLLVAAADMSVEQLFAGASAKLPLIPTALIIDLHPFSFSD